MNLVTPAPGRSPQQVPAAPVSDNAILAISARAAQLRAQGLDVVDLAAGEPDTATARFIAQAATSDALPGVTCPRPTGGVFVLPDVTRAVERGGWANTEEMATDLLERTGVAVVPGEPSDVPGHLCKCVAVSPATLRTAVQRLSAAPAPASSASTASTRSAHPGRGAVSATAGTDHSGAP